MRKKVFLKVKKPFLIQNRHSIIILLFLKAKLSIFAWGLIFVDENYLNASFKLSDFRNGREDKNRRLLVMLMKKIKIFLNLKFFQVSK